MNKQVLHEFQRNTNEKVRISMGSYRDKDYVDIRVFYADEATGNFNPTKKGITLAYELMPQLKAGLLACDKAFAEQSRMVRA